VSVSSSVPPLSFDWFNSTATHAGVLTADFVFDCLFLLLLAVGCVGLSWGRGCLHWVDLV
jgi:hypothetical protein